ncbi:MAG: hypothetical protein M5U28_27100 [Sandaracinaceae bacterium]|nr:hypothetical protein [Sandaracinaceae bacterium]
MKRAAPLAALVVIAASAPGCVSSVEERSTARGGLGLSLSGSAPADSIADADGHDAPCIMEVPGTGIRMLDTDRGLAVVFDTVEGGRSATCAAPSGGSARPSPESGTTTTAGTTRGARWRSR